MTDDPIAEAEKIVREHEWICVGIREPETPYCSAAPNGTPLCDACSYLRDAIAAALASAQAEIAHLRQERAEALRVLDQFNVGNDLVATCKQAYLMLSRRRSP